MKWYDIQRLFNNSKPLVYLIALFVGLIFLLFSIHSRGADLYVDAGSAMVRGYTPTLGLNIVWHNQGPANTDYEAGFNIIGQSDFNGKHQSNQFVTYGMLSDSWKNMGLGLGFAYFNVPSDYNCQFTFSMLARYRFSDNFHVQWHHFSTSGSCEPNYGRDLLTVGWRF